MLGIELLPGGQEDLGPRGHEHPGQGRLTTGLSILASQVLVNIFGGRGDVECVSCQKSDLGGSFS